MVVRPAWKVVALCGVLAPAAVALGWGWGSDIRGNGQAKTEARPLAGFTRVSNATSLGVDVAQGDHFAVTVTTDGNLLPLVLTTIEGDTLRIHADQSFSPSAKSSVQVVLPSLSGIVAAGSGDVRAHGFAGSAPLELKTAGSGDLSFEGTAGDLTLASAGSGTTLLRGKAAKLTISGAGSGAVDAAGLPATGAMVKLSGSGPVSLNVNGDVAIDDVGSGEVRAVVNGGTLDARVLGSGEVVWSGNGHEGKITMLGSGRVVHR